MNGKCLDIGTIQAFLDGETTQDESLRFSHHIAGCDACANLLAVAEDENSFVFSTLEREMNALVPTQRLWNRINNSIEIEKSNVPVWRQIFALISASLASPSMTAAAGVLIVFGFVAAVWTLRSDTASNDEPTIASVPQGNPNTPSVPQPGNSQSEFSNPVSPTQRPDSGALQVSESKLPNEQLQGLVPGNNARKEIRPITLNYSVPLEGEQGYIKTISDLKQNVDGRKDAVFTASSRVSFESDLAVVNDAIGRMQKVVRKNPRNQAARQVLYSAYQDKIDLLNSVSQQDELMASVR